MRAERDQRRARCAGRRASRGGAGCLGVKRGTWILRLYTRAPSSRLGDCVLKIRRMIPNIITTDPTQGALGGEKMKRRDSYMATYSSRALCLSAVWLLKIDYFIL